MLPESLACPVSPVSGGQDLEAELKALAADNACTQLNTARTRRFKLLRDLKGVQKRAGRKLEARELGLPFMNGTGSRSSFSIAQRP